MKIYIGVDIGGTKTAIAVLDENMNILARTSVSTGKYKTCEDLVKEACGKANELLAEAGAVRGDIVSCGVASPGPLDYEKGSVIRIPTLGWENEPLVEYFEKYMGVPVFLQKDTNAAVFYEALMGEGKDSSIVSYITVSTGVGSGLCIDGKIITGNNGLAGEIGHFQVMKNGRRCGCGSRGCLEAYASGTSISKIISERLGRHITAKEAFDMERKGNPIAIAVISRAGDCIAYAISALCQTVDPGTIVFGGSVTKDFDVLRPYIERSLKKYVEPIGTRKTKILLSDKAGDQTLKGAALYGKKCFEKSI